MERSILITEESITDDAAQFFIGASAVNSVYYDFL
jgi:hypothetical protein